MFIAEKPYVSHIFKDTVCDNHIPVVDTPVSRELFKGENAVFISVDEAVQSFREGKGTPLYTNSENAIGWITKNLGFSSLPEQINVYKNKALFREKMRYLHPDFFFQEVPLEKLTEVDISTVPRPCVVKPNVGFFSLGVYIITTTREWDSAVASIRTEADYIQTLYPTEVLDSQTYIIEECIRGDEFAIDGYIDSAGNPVVLNILKHYFASEKDVNDRIYMTSKDIVEANLGEFTDFLGTMGALGGVKTFPLHVEVRRTKDGVLIPIEVNPMRFGGWCTTADTCYHSLGINPYLYYYNQLKPDWAQVFSGKEDKLFSLIVLDNSTGYKGEHISSFDYEKVVASFKKVYELRKANHKEFPIFGFLFVETEKNNTQELKNILNSDLSEFCSFR